MKIPIKIRVSEGVNEGTVLYFNLDDMVSLKAVEVVKEEEDRIIIEIIP